MLPKKKKNLVFFLVLKHEVKASLEAWNKISRIRNTSGIETRYINIVVYDSNRKSRII